VDRVAATDWARCCKFAVKSQCTTPGILIRNDGVFYWKANARTEIPVSLCARDATTCFILDKWIRQAFAMRFRIEAGMRSDPGSTTRRSLTRRVSSWSRYIRSKKSELQKLIYCRKLLRIKKNWPTRMIVKQLAASWKINLFSWVFFLTIKVSTIDFFFLLYIIKRFYMVTRSFVSKLPRNNHMIKIL